jgi:hypothetical protein
MILAIVNGVLDFVFPKRRAAIDGQHRIDIKALAENLLLMHHAMASEEGAVLHPDCVAHF